VADSKVSKDVEALLSRATGDQYLLGVGKADITGYILFRSPFTYMTNIF
jgi:hypothetical protein